MVAVAILAAGRGTRMKSALPKVLHQLGGRSLVERVLESCQALSPQRRLVIVGYQAEQVKADLLRSNIIGNGQEVRGTRLEGELSVSSKASETNVESNLSHPPHSPLKGGKPLPLKLVLIAVILLGIYFVSTVVNRYLYSERSGSIKYYAYWGKGEWVLPISLGIQLAQMRLGLHLESPSFWY